MSTQMNEQGDRSDERTGWPVNCSLKEQDDLTNEMNEQGYQSDERNRVTNQMKKQGDQSDKETG
jgi:hypothetical protein